MGETTNDDSEFERVLGLCLTAGRGLLGRVVLEVLWDGDTTGWFLDLYATRRGTRRHAVTLRYGSDVRAFTGEVPPWPEATMARRVADTLEEQHDWTIWYPSEDPDVDSATYAQRDEATRCERCGKPFMKNDSPYVSDRLCDSCETDERRKAEAEERRLRLLEEPGPLEDARPAVICVAQPSGTIGMWSLGYRSVLETIIADEYPDRADFTRDQRFDSSAVSRLAANARRRLEDELESYVPPEKEYWGDPVEWEGATYILERLGGGHHALLRDLMYRTEWLEGTTELALFSNRGIRLRQGHLLDVLRDNAPSTKSEIVAAVQDAFGSSEAVVRTIHSLTELGCVETDGKRIELTEKGRVMTWPEER